MVLLYHFWQYRAYFSVRYCLKEIGAWAFFECDGLETVEYRGSEEQKKAIQIEVGNDPLENCLAKNSAVRTVAEFAEQHKQQSKDNMERE